jgi:hypothetical protein
MVYVCQYGHKDPDDKRKKLVHPNSNDCEFYRAKHPAKTVSMQTAPPTTEPPKPAVTPEPGPAPQPMPFSGAPTPGKLTVTRETATTIAAPEVPTKADTTEWLLSSDDVVSFWAVIFSIAEMVLNAILSYFKAPKLPPEICDIKNSKSTQFLMNRHMRVTTTQLFISAGVKTPETAHNLIQEGEGIVAFGGIILAIVWHMVKEIPKTEVYKEWKTSVTWLNPKKEPSKEMSDIIKHTPPITPIGATA